jgi:hypothetical protein
MTVRVDWPISTKGMPTATPAEMSTQPARGQGEPLPDTAEIPTVFRE